MTILLLFSRKKKKKKKISSLFEPALNQISFCKIKKLQHQISLHASPSTKSDWTGPKPRCMERERNPTSFFFKKKKS